MLDIGLALLRRRQYLPLFITQFFGAFNDNAFKLAMLTLISYHITRTQDASEHYQAIAGALFILPFFLLSATAGQLADKYDKSIMIRWIKAFECILMVVGAFGLYYGYIPLLMITLTGMGVHSTFFGPIKYAILPDHLERTELLSATALIEGSTFLAILLGTTLGTLSIGSESAHTPVAIVLTLMAAVIGFIACWFIPTAPSRAPLLQVDWHIWRATKNMIGDVMENQQVLPAIFAISWFWLIGAVMLTKLPDYIHYVLNANAVVFAFFLSLFSIGIALGSLAISLFLNGRITLRYVPYCMLLLSVFAYDLFWTTPEPVTQPEALQTFLVFIMDMVHLRIALDFFFFSFCCGLFTVPLYAYLQVCCDETSRARTIAANNIWNAFFMVLGALLVMVLIHFKVTITLFFLVLAVMNAIATGLLFFFMFYQATRSSAH